MLIQVCIHTPAMYTSPISPTYLVLV